MIENVETSSEKHRLSSVCLAAPEEFAAAWEASTGVAREADRSAPMTPSAVREAFDELLVSRRPDRGLDVLERTGIIAAVLPEVQDMVGFGEGIRHKDVWEHTKKVVRQSPPRPALRWAALLHDIGKVPTRRFEPDGQVTFIGHPEVGARMFKRIARRLQFDADLGARVRFLIAAHLRASSYEESWTDSAVRRFAKDVGDALDDLLDLSRADITSKYVEKVRRGLRQIDRLQERIEFIRQQDARPAPLPKGLGNALIERFSIVPGRCLGVLMKRLICEVEEGRLGVQESYDHYLRAVEQNPLWLEEMGMRTKP